MKAFQREVTMRVSQFTLASVARARRQAVVAAIARREWLLRVLGLAAAGCGPAKDRALARGNTLIVAVSDDRPLVVDAGGFEALVFLPLLKANEHGDYRACLATEWKHSADYREWTLRLRPNVRWHDGRPLTMDDVTFTLGTLSRPDNPAFGNRTESVTVHDESTFTVRGVDWPHYLEWSILPKHLCEGLDVPKFYDWDFWRHPIGCGPYRYVRDDPHTMVELEGNPDYYKGQPKIDRVVLKLSGQAGLTELLSGNVDVIELANPAELPKLANDPRFRAYYVPYRRSWVIKWQNQHPLFRDRNVRRALSLAIDRRELLQVLNLPKDFPLAEGVYTRRQFQRGEFPEAPRYDPTEAKRLLDEAGWRARASDVRERDGREFRFTSLALNERAWNETAIYVQDQLRRIGVRMELQRAERSAVGSG